jgi:UDP-3-O-[3-hydroxymyristoyl] glucosamine N-acyltransferase
MKLNKIAEIVQGRIIGSPDIDITGVAGIEEAKAGDITFLSHVKNERYAFSTNASAIIAKEEIRDVSASLIIVRNPQLAFARTLDIFYKQTFKSIGISKGTVAGENVSVGDDVSIHPMVFLGNNVSIGNRTVLFPHVYVGDNVTIGDDSIVYPQVTIREKVTVGRRVIIHSGTVIGSDGFGYVQESGKHYKIPQVGGIIIDDDVEIGANVTIDRATVGNTTIGSGTKIDNLVQIAHNVRIGKNCIIIAQVAIGGSAEISDGVILAGQVAVRDHVKIGKGVMIGGQSGVGQDISDGQMFSGTPAIPHRTWMKAQSIYSKLPEYIRRLRKLERKIEEEEKTKNG